MTTIGAPTRLLSVLIDGRRSDVSVPAGLEVAELVRQAGLPAADPGLSVSAGDGRRLDLSDPVGAVLADGELIIISFETDTTRAMAAPAPVRRPAVIGAGAQQLFPVTAGLALAAQFLVTVLLSRHGGGQLSGPARVVVGGLGSTTALALALSAATRRRPEPAHAAAVAIAFVSGFSVIATSLTGHAELAVTVGAIAAAVAAATSRSARPDRTELASVLLVLSLVVAAGFGVALQVGGGLMVPAAILLGLVPAAYRLLPSYSIDVPDEQLIDVDRLSVTAWAARGGRRTGTRRIRPGEVEIAVGRAQRMVSSATAVLALVTVVLAGVVLTLAGPGLSRWGAVAELALVIVTLGLLPRTARSTLDKITPRLAGAGLVAELGLFGVTHSSSTTSAGLAAVFVLAGLTAIGSATALAGGWLSVRISRLADAVESVAVVLALPAALLAVDAIATFRQLTS